MAESFLDTKEQELLEVAGKVPSLKTFQAKKDKDLQEGLVDLAMTDRLLGLVMEDFERLNPILIRAICEKFV